MPLYALGLNHATAPVKVREQVAFQPDTLGVALRDLIAQPSVKEAAILSTCNRTEVYFSAAEAGAGRALAGELPPGALRIAASLCLHTGAGSRGLARVPRRQRARFDGARRAADSRPDEARGAQRRSGGRAGPDPQSPFSAHVRGGQGRAHATPTSAARRFRWPRRRSSSPSESIRRWPTSTCC